MQSEVGAWKTSLFLLAFIGTYCVPGTVLGPGHVGMSQTWVLSIWNCLPTGRSEAGTHSVGIPPSGMARSGFLWDAVAGDRQPWSETLPSPPHDLEQVRLPLQAPGLHLQYGPIPSASEMPGGGIL